MHLGQATDTKNSTRGGASALPSRRLAAIQSEWLLGARARLLRLAGINTRRRIVDLGCGGGHVATELCDAIGGTVLALDCRRDALRELRDGHHDPTGDSLRRIIPIAARAERLPLRTASCDLVFCQCAMLWFADPAVVLAEVARVLVPGGMFCAVEPDFGGLMEWPVETAVREVWLPALQRAGADPLFGRRLPSLCAAAGLMAEVRLLDQPGSASLDRFDLLEELPLLDTERKTLTIARSAAAKLGPHAVAHLPFWLIAASKIL
ncbi:MAG: methyltransferase domain-containing protein [Planctomycetia bacterium]|nr:methyltransferase domain-containing protein [Planctomycetia bacterium]